MKYKATGSLSNLIECTSNETPKKIANRRQDLSSIIFKPEFEIILPLKRHKSYVNLGNIKKDTSFAGLKSGNKEENIFNKESNLKYFFLIPDSPLIKDVLGWFQIYLVIN